jgi:hypothetical protein
MPNAKVDVSLDSQTLRRVDRLDGPQRGDEGDVLRAGDSPVKCGRPTWSVGVLRTCLSEAQEFERMEYCRRERARRVER